MLAAVGENFGENFGEPEVQCCPECCTSLVLIQLSQPSQHFLLVMLLAGVAGCPAVLGNSQCAASVPL